MFPQHSLGTGGHAEMIERLKVLKTKDIAKATTDSRVDFWPYPSFSPQSTILDSSGFGLSIFDLVILFWYSFYWYLWFGKVSLFGLVELIL